MDAGLLDALSEATASYARGYYVAEPADLLGVVRVHVNRLAGLATATMTTGQRQRLGSVTSDAAALGGWLALDSDRRGEARAYFALARDAAREAGDATLHALATASIGASCDAQHGGDPAEAAWYLRQAVGQVPDHAPGYVRAWLHAQRAKEEAAAGHAYAFQAGMEHAHREHDRGETDERPGSFWSDAAWFGYLGLPGWQADHEARGLAYLGHADAEDALTRLLAEAIERRTSARLHVFLAEWHLDRTQPAEAAQVATQALGGTPQWDARVRALRGRLQPWAGLPAVRDLDEALTLAAA